MTAAHPSGARRRPWQHGRIEHVPLPVIGIVRTSRAEREATPIQAAVNRAEHGAIDIADAYARLARPEPPP